jgi:general secretion pathway protein G
MDIPDRYAGRELFCTSCKERFTAPEALPPEPLPDGDEGVGCPACGRRNPADATYCSSCGGSLVSFLGDSDPMQRPGTISVLAVLNFLGGAFTSLGGLAILATAADQGAVVVGIGVVYLLISGIQITTGVGLWNLRPWGRTLQIVLACIGLIGFPIGTLVSALILYYLFRPGIKALFSGKQASELTPDERASLAELSASGVSAITVIIVILVGIVLCGIVSAIAIPNLLNAINRGRQKRSMADMRLINIAVEAYKVDNGVYPPGASSIDDLENVLAPTYLRSVPHSDGWRTPFQVWITEDGASFSVVSYGRDKAEGPSPGGATHDFDDDIILQDGQFVQWPEGIATQ